MMVKEMMGMSPLFGQFIAEKGLNFVLDNMEGKGVEQLKALTDEWLKEYQQEKQAAMQAQQQQGQQNPAMMKNQIEMAKLQQKGQSDQMQLQLDMAKLQHDQQKVMADLRLGQQSANVQIVKAMTEKFSKEVDLELKHKDMSHRHTKEMIETHHKINLNSERRSHV